MEFLDKKKSKDLFECTKTKSFISKSYVCDGFFDCASKEDEKDCDEREKKYFICTSSQKKSVTNMFVIISKIVQMNRMKNFAVQLSNLKIKTKNNFFLFTEFRECKQRFERWKKIFFISIYIF